MVGWIRGVHGPLLVRTAQRSVHGHALPAGVHLEQSTGSFRAMSLGEARRRSVHQVPVPSFRGAESKKLNLNDVLARWRRTLVLATHASDSLCLAHSLSKGPFDALCRLPHPPSLTIVTACSRPRRPQRSWPRQPQYSGSRTVSHSGALRCSRQAKHIVGLREAREMASTASHRDIVEWTAAEHDSRAMLASVRVGIAGRAQIQR